MQNQDLEGHGVMAERIGIGSSGEAIEVRHEEQETAIMGEKLRQQVELAQKLFDDRTHPHRTPRKAPERQHTSLGEAIDVLHEEQETAIMGEKLRQQVELAQKLFDDRTLPHHTPRKAPERQHSSLHILWGALLLLLVVFVRRLPRILGGKVPEAVEAGDPLRFWESKQLIGDNDQEGLMGRLRAEPGVISCFLKFTELSKESFDRRDALEQRKYNIQKQLVNMLNPLLVVTDRMSALLQQIPPQSGTVPGHYEDIMSELKYLSEVKAWASDAKSAFLGDWSAARMEKEVYSEPAASDALNRLLCADAIHMHAKTLLLDFQLAEAMKARDREASVPFTAKKELQALEAKAQLAASACEREAAFCMKVLPPNDHWMLMLFVKHLPQASPVPDQ